MTTAQPHIVLVDDEEDLREPVAAYLSEHGLDVSEASGGRALDAVIAARPAQLVVLDVSMPDEDGFSIARRLRAGQTPIGIIMLTARRDVVDRIEGLDIGADDYIMKPFDPAELLARIRAVLRRVGEPLPVVTVPVAAPTGQYVSEFWIPTGRGQIRVPIDTVERIEAAKDYVLLHTAERAHMLRVTMAELEHSLSPADMIRVHRSSFIRPDAVTSFSQVGRNATLVLKSGASVRVGPQHIDEVKGRVGR